jgi:protease I
MLLQQCPRGQVPKKGNFSPRPVFSSYTPSLKGDTIMSDTLEGKKIAFLATDGFEQEELTKPWNALKEAGADVELVSLKKGAIQGMSHDEKADPFPVDKTVEEADTADYDGLVLPGGVANPDKLRMDEKAVSFVKAFFDQDKPVAAICHGPWTLVEADVVGGKTLTSWPSLKTDITNAGGQWVDEEVCVDQGLVTSRKPDDLDAFCEKAIEQFAQGAQREIITSLL